MKIDKYNIIHISDSLHSDIIVSYKYDIKILCCSLTLLRYCKQHIQIIYLYIYFLLFYAIYKTIFISYNVYLKKILLHVVK